MSGFANNPIVAFNDGPLFYILCGVFNGIFVIDIVLFIHMSRTEAALRVRGLFLSITHVLAGIVYTTNTFINLPVRPYYSCPLYFSMASIGLTAWATSLGLRFWRLMWLAEFNRELFEKERKRRLEIRHGSVAAIRGSNPEVLPLQIAPGHPPNILNVGNPPQVIQNIRYQNPACATRFGTMCVTTADSSPISLNRGTPHATALVPIHETNEGHSLSTLDVSQPTRPWWDVLLRRRRAQEITATILTHPPTDTKNMFTRVIHYLAKIRILQPQFHEHVFFIIVFLATIAVVMAILLHPLFAQGKDSILRNCRATWPFDMLNAGQGSFFLVIFPLITIIVWNTTNIYGIRNEVLIQCLLGCVCMTTFLLLRYVSGPGWARARANFPIEMVLTILIIFSHIMSIVWPMVYIKYERRALRKHRKKASKILCDILTKSTSENINEFEAFLDALDYPEIKVALHRYSVHDFTVENLAFAGRLRYLDQILRRGRPEDYAPYYRTLYRHTDGIPLPGNNNDNHDIA
ncbi:hypothetical protein BDF22DRAFT_517918 [Syncephalis plumigaleata]|nr:hypothetical protein BDF22DRAFT_517918 [Syncephalis plumigaleata]